MTKPSASDGPAASALIMEADPGVVEEWKWMGTPVWSHVGIICTGESYKTIVKLTFAKGASTEVVMPRWLRIDRGMVGTGVTFAVAVGAIAATVALAGVLFTGGLALTARGRTFDRLSLRYVTGMGAGGGVLYFLLIA